MTGGNEAGPCPYCGGMGKIPDGTYRYAADTLEFLRESEVSDLRALERVLKEAKTRKYEPEQLAKEIAATAPRLSKLGALMPQSRAELQNYILIILAALAVLVPALSEHPTQPPPTVIQIFNSIKKE
jgi:hypothetical protein